MSHFPDTYSIGASGQLSKMDPALEYDGDPRGILWMWEPPSRGSQYIMGIDPTVGRTGWNRYNRVREDRKTDNGAIELLRIGKDGRPDVQAAEFAAPVDAFELGYIANVIGRLYAGTEEDQCKCILEVYPGPGGMTYQTMIQIGYLNHFRWEYYANTPATPTKSMGWTATPKSNRDLWVKASRHINLRNVRINSPFLVEEYADCRMDPIKQYGENPSGHDDRVRAFNLAVWCANGWSLDIERTSEPVRPNTNMIEWQNTDMTMEEIREQWANSFDRLNG